MFDSLTEKLQGVFTGLKSKGRLSEKDIDEAMREIRLALLEADVNYKVVKRFVAKTKERCLTAEVLGSLTPGQNVVKVVLDELTELLGGEDGGLKLSSRIPNVIMLVGLQGSGKTTAAVKLAYRLKKAGHQPLLAACDVYRPAAADQLETLGTEIGVKVFRGDGADPVGIARAAVREAIDTLRDIVIVDTAGRLHVDQQMMEEAAAIKGAVQPEQVLMVVDAMTGQDAVNVAKAFAEQVDFDGVIMSKMDGDARGGAALSILEVTGKPIKFISEGERPDSLSEFHPDRMAKRILGQGDVVSLIEAAVEANDRQVSEAEAKRLAKADLTLDDFVNQLVKVRKMGGLAKIISALPGGDEAIRNGQVDERQLDQVLAIVRSMTPAERQKPSIINGERRARIAKGSGVQVQQVNQLLKRFNEAKKMTKKMTAQLNGKGGKRLRRKMGKGDLSGFQDLLGNMK
ncbi:MAG: signal recognition particle protein [Coriobacteriales bacterium]|nr:signal recognition particle protein [Coriobacteriales bacterium]